MDQASDKDQRRAGRDAAIRALNLVAEEACVDKVALRPSKGDLQTFSRKLCKEAATKDISILDSWES